MVSFAGFCPLPGACWHAPTRSAAMTRAGAHLILLISPSNRPSAGQASSPMSPLCVTLSFPRTGRSSYARVGRPDVSGRGASEEVTVAQEPHLRVSHVTKRFGGVTAVDDVSFDVPKGAFATLLGPSGCGKTTTLRMIAGFYDPDVGDIEIGNKRATDLPAHRRGTALAFQDSALFPH